MPLSVSLAEEDDPMLLPIIYEMTKVAMTTVIIPQKSIDIPRRVLDIVSCAHHVSQVDVLGPATADINKSDWGLGLSGPTRLQECIHEH